MERHHAAPVVGTSLVLVVFALNRIEFAGGVGSFPGYGLVVTFALAVVGGATLVSGLGSLVVRRWGRDTTVALLAFGITLLFGSVVLYLTFGCVFYGCPG